MRLKFAAIILVASLGLLPRPSEGASDAPDMSDCFSDTPFVAECQPLRMGETLALIVEVSNRSTELSALDATIVEEAAVRVLTEGLQAPTTGTERSRADVKITSQTVGNLATFAWRPPNLDTTTTVLLQCSIGDIRGAAAATGTVSVACQMTRGRMKVVRGWMTGYQDHSAEPLVALLTGRGDVDSATLRALLQHVFAKMIYISRIGH